MPTRLIIRAVQQQEHPKLLRWYLCGMFGEAGMAAVAPGNEPIASPARVRTDKQTRAGRTLGRSGFGSEQWARAPVLFPVSCGPSILPSRMPKLPGNGIAHEPYASGGRRLGEDLTPHWRGCSTYDVGLGGECRAMEKSSAASSSFTSWDEARSAGGSAVADMWMEVTLNIDDSRLLRPVNKGHTAALASALRFRKVVRCQRAEWVDKMLPVGMPATSTLRNGMQLCPAFFRNDNCSLAHLRATVLCSGQVCEDAARPGTDCADRRVSAVKAYARE